MQAVLRSIKVHKRNTLRSIKVHTGDNPSWLLRYLETVAALILCRCLSRVLSYVEGNTPSGVLRYMQVIFLQDI